MVSSVAFHGVMRRSVLLSRSPCGGGHGIVNQSLSLTTASYETIFSFLLRTFFSPASQLQKNIRLHVMDTCLHIFFFLLIFMDESLQTGRGNVPLVIRKKIILQANAIRRFNRFDLVGLHVWENVEIS